MLQIWSGRNFVFFGGCLVGSSSEKDGGRLFPLAKIAFSNGPERPDGEDSVGDREGDSHECFEGELEERTAVIVGLPKIPNDPDRADCGGSKVEPHAPENNWFSAWTGRFSVGVMIGGFHLPGVGACRLVERSTAFPASRGAFGFFSAQRRQTS